MVQNLTKKASPVDVEQKEAIQETYTQQTVSEHTEENNENITVADAVAQMFENLGIKSAYGVSGGAMASLWGALSNSDIDVLNFRHEAGAAFSATEGYFASGNPTVVFTTAGPGITNALTGLFAARGEGAKVILLSACTSAPQRGRWAIQETSTDTLPSSGIFTTGTVFNYASTIESAAQLPQIFRKLALGLSQPGGYVAHITIPTAVQNMSMDEARLPEQGVSCSLVTSSSEVVANAAKLLCEGTFAIWLGFGARGAADEIRQLAETTGAAVMCSPRGKGIFPENHPQFVGVTGLGGHGSAMTYMQEQAPVRTLVLGSRLSEPTSFWNQEMVPSKGFIHVDIDPNVPGVAYPHAETIGIQSDVKAFVSQLLRVLEADERTESQFKASQPSSLPKPERCTVELGEESPIRPEILMEAIQHVIVDGSDAVVMAECGNSFTWSTNLLRFSQANRYRVSTGVGAMGHAVTGVVGAAQARNGKAVAIVGDGAMLMNNEISTAVKYQIPAIWIVLNDARYNMCHQGMKMLGMTGADATIPETDFEMIARGMGAEGIRVIKESDITAALQKAIAANGPVIIDVLIDPDRPAPSKGRNKGLASQGVKSTSEKKPKAQASFPNI
ncbi:MAG: scytonemin biosynthesis protein ScyA [Cyanobacteria bacterium P01_D01_bin.116]